MFRELLYPQRCFLCDQLVSYSQEILLCRQCRPELYIPRGSRCVLCGRPVPEAGVKCTGCREHKNQIAGRSTFLYDGAVRDSIRKFKYEGRKDYASGYARAMACLDRDWLDALGDCFLIPVPVHSRRKRSRGYNQAQVLAVELARIIKVPVWNGLVRSRETAPLQTMAARARREMLKGAFRVQRPEKLPEGTAVLVDDIYTSGSTIEECAGTLGGAYPGIDVRFWTLAIRP